MSNYKIIKIDNENGVIGRNLLDTSGQTFLNRGTSQSTIPTGTTFNVYDAVTVRVNRDASDSRDTANNITGYIYGLIFNYKANN